MNLLLDTNVVIDYLGRKEPFFELAQQVVAAGFFGDATLWMPAQSAADAFYVLNHYLDSARVQSLLARLFEVVKPVALSAEELFDATRLQWDDYEDCLVMLAALKAHADYLITRDKKGFTRSAVPALTPQEWLALQAKRGISYTPAELSR